LADDGGTVTMYLDGHYSIEFTATANTTTDLWEFRVASTATDDITPYTKAGQKYDWRILGVLSGVTYDLGAGNIFVYPNPDVTAGDDRRSHSQKMVPLLEAEIEARILGTGTGHSSYQIGSRQIEKIAIEQLRALLKEYKGETEAEQFGTPRPFLVYRGFRR
jgi:hypothetical protein